MDEKLIIAVNSDCAEIFEKFMQNHDGITKVEHRSFIGGNEIVDFIVELTPQLLTALTTYLIARLQNSKKEIKVRKGDLEIELKNTNLTLDDTVEFLKK